MAITADALRWYQAERMTDEEDGGGQMSGREIVPGDENQIFDDLSDVDRAAGDVSIRKPFAAVGSSDDDKYLDAGVVVFRPPADPAVSVTAFSTGDYYDERAALVERLESQVVRGGLFTGWLWGDHIIGQRAVTLWQRLSSTVPSSGQRMELVKRSSSTTVATQVVWVTRVVEEIIERVDLAGLYQVRMLTCEIAEPLRADYVGLEPTRIDPTTTGANGTLVYETRYNPDAVSMVGISPLVEDAEVGDFTVKINSLYSPMIPTAFAETALADVNPGGDTATLVPGADGTITATTTLDVLKPNAGMYLGCPVMPGTLTITCIGSTFTDQGGKMFLGSTEVGTIDYGAGAIVWNSACPALGTNTKTSVFQPGALPSRVADTDRAWCLLENRGFVWVRTLFPIPAPGTLRVSYRANNEWYLLAEDGGGQLRGADSSYGTGTLNYSTGTVTITTGALPDPDSEIMFAWGTPVDYMARGGAAVDPLVVRGQTANPGVLPGSFQASWAGGTLTDDSEGNLTGTGGSGTITYSTGEWEITPTTVPSMGTEFDIDYDWGTPIEETFLDVDVDGGGLFNLTLSNPAVDGSVLVEYTLYGFINSSYSTHFDYTAKDDGVGGMAVADGAVGTINYATGAIAFNPSTSKSVVVDVYDWR